MGGNPGEHRAFAPALAALDVGDGDTLARLLKEHPDLAHARSMSEEGCYAGYFWRPTLLHHVAGNPYRNPLPDNVLEITRVLLEAGADVNAECGGGPAQPTTGGGTTLGLVASGSQAHIRGFTEPLLDLLLEYGARLDHADRPGGAMWIALYHTVEHQGQRDVARMLYDRGHEVDMCFAAGLGERQIVLDYLRDDGGLRPGADRLYRHHRGDDVAATDAEILQDVLLFAVTTNRSGIVDLCLERGADVNRPRPWGSERPTPVHAAVWAGWREMVAHLVERGADLRSRDPNHLSSPIGWAAYVGRDEILHDLLADPRNLDLADAVELGIEDRVIELLGDGDPNQAAGQGTPGVLLRAAAGAGHLAIVELLLERGADPNLPNADGKTALFWATHRGHDRIADLLRRHGGRPT